MGQIFTYYQSDKYFKITDASNVGLYSFTLISQNLQLTDITIASPFVGTQQSDGFGNYHLTFNYKPGGTPTVSTFSSATVFVVNSSATLQSNVTLNWTIDVSNNTYPYSDPYNATNVAYNSGYIPEYSASLGSSRINNFYGQTNSDTNAKTFGQTISDRHTVPNKLQTTIVPLNVDSSVASIQNINFILNNSVKSDSMGSVPAVPASSSLTITPDLTLSSNNYYQFAAHLTIILRPTNSSTYVCGNYTVYGAARNNALIGSTGYSVSAITKDSSMDTYVPTSAISLTIVSNKFTINMTPIANVSYSADMLANINITSTIYSSAI